MTDYDVSVTEAVSGAACPKCKAVKGSWCVYLPPVSGPQGHRSPAMIAKAARAGRPMQTVHPERRAVIRELREWAAIREQRKWAVIRERRKARADRASRKASSHPRPSRAALEAAHALREFDRREYAQMRAWLAAHGHLLRNANMTGARST